MRMNREDVVKLAREANITGGDSFTDDCFIEVLKRFANLVVQKEHQRCIGICEDEASEYGTDQDGWYAARGCADRIRELASVHD
jgi:hypothetical protein